MREKDLDRAFGNTPPAFTGRINQTLAQLEDKPRRIPRLRAALIVAAVLALLCGIAYAGRHGITTTGSPPIRNTSPRSTRPSWIACKS